MELGRLFLGWIWGIAHKVWWSLFALLPIPILSFVIGIILGAQGNVLAWKNNHYSSVEEFRKIQKKWAIAGLIVFITVCILIGVGFYLLVHFGNKALEGEGTTVGQLYKEATFNQDLQKLENGTKSFIEKNKRLPKSMSEIFSSYDPKTILVLEGLTTAPKDINNEPIKYCVKDNNYLFIYNSDNKTKTSTYHKIDKTTSHIVSGTITDQEAATYKCVQY